MRFKFYFFFQEICKIKILNTDKKESFGILEKLHYK